MFGKIYRRDQKIKSFCAVIGGLISVVTLGAGGPIFTEVMQVTSSGAGDQLFSDAFEFLPAGKIVDFVENKATNHRDEKIAARR